MKNENIKESNKLLVNYIYTLQEDIYKSRVEIRNHIIDTDKNNPVNIFYIETRAKDIATKANEILKICQIISSNESYVLNKYDNLKERDKAKKELAIYYKYI